MTLKKVDNYIINMANRLGDGAFGEVFLGLDSRDKQEIAIKIIPKQRIDCDENIQESYIIEMKIMKKLKSNNIVEFIDVAETDNHYYIIQEYCNGGDLRKKMMKVKKFSEAEVIACLKDILRGFITLLQQGVVHRDVKPENILIKNNKMKIADFGFAKVVLSTSELNKTLVGTPLYMSPQLLKPQKYTSKCDIWAIGVMAYQMLMGKLPWIGNTQLQLLMNIRKMPLKFSDQVKISQEIKDFISGCLKIEESDRFSWKEVYTHKIFDNEFNKSIEKIDLEERKFLEAINNLRIMIHTNDIDLEKVFQSLELTPQTKLNKEIFMRILKGIDQSGKTNEDFDIIIKKLSEKSDNIVMFESFKKFLKNNNIETKSLTNRKIEDKVGSKVRPIVKKLKSRLKDSGIEIEQLFVSYAKSKTAALNFDKFEKLFLKVDKSLSREDIQACFAVFDNNKDGQIMFEDFDKTIKHLAA